MIGGGRDDAPIAPLFRAFAEYVHAGAAFTGSFQSSGRLDLPLLFALDEVTQICPVPLPLWMADSAGKGVLIVAVCHGLAQLEARWENAGARAIWDTAGIKVILGGVSDPDTLDRLSRLSGEIAVRTRSRSRGHDGHWGDTVSYQPVRVLPPELLRTLPDRRALVIRGNLSPVVIRLRMAWRRLDYLQGRLSARTPHRMKARTDGLPALPWEADADSDAAPTRVTDPAITLSTWEALDDERRLDAASDTGSEAEPTGRERRTEGWPAKSARSAWLPPGGTGSRSRRPWEPDPDSGEALR